METPIIDVTQKVNALKTLSRDEIFILKKSVRFMNSHVVFPDDGNDRLDELETILSLTLEQKE